MAIKPQNSDFDVQKDNPLVNNLFNYSSPSTTLSPPPGSSFMITEIAGDFMQMELSTDLMITEF